MPSCGTGSVWSGNTCALTSCTIATTGLACLLSGGGIGLCAGTTCIDALSDSQSCGGQGIICPSGYTCTQGVCTNGSGPACYAYPSPCASDALCVGTGCATLSCADQADGTVCGVGSAAGTCCGHACLATGTDDANCGACGHVCTGGGLCLEGVCSTTCTIDNAACFGAFGEGLCCQGACVSPTDSGPTNCGYCGSTCPAGDTCESGSCTGSSTSCPSGESYNSVFGCLANTCPAGLDGVLCFLGETVERGSCCRDACVAFLTDASNCGGCGLHCPEGTFCWNAACLPVTDCQNQGNSAPCVLADSTPGVCCSGTCVDRFSDDANCGACGTMCPTGASCMVATVGDATCTASCPGSACPSGAACTGSGNCSTTTCTGFADGTPCAYGAGDAASMCCGGTCVSPTDVDNCGGCGFGCPAGYTCDGQCHQGGGDFYCPEPGDVTCPSGTACDGIECSALSCQGLSDGDTCAAGPGATGACCGGKCVQTFVDLDNCGGCGQACDSVCAFGECQSDLPSVCAPTCAPGEVCAGGVCVGSQCDGGSYCAARDGAIGTCCGEACSDLTEDASNCGACGIACPGGSACVAGVCDGSACNASNQGSFCEAGSLTKACCGTTCTDTSTDASNCGGCNRPCMGGSCVQGACE